METKIARSTGFTIETSNGKKEQIEFDTMKLAGQQIEGRNKQFLQNLQLNNFCQALKCGYMDREEKNFFGMRSWQSKLCVLTNVGLLYFDNPLKPPQDLFPILNCQLTKVHHNE